MTRMRSKAAPDASAAGRTKLRVTERLTSSWVRGWSQVCVTPVKEMLQGATHLSTSKFGIGRNGCVPLKQPVALSVHFVRYSQARRKVATGNYALGCLPAMQDRATGICQVHRLAGSDCVYALPNLASRLDIRKSVIEEDGQR